MANSAAKAFSTSQQKVFATNMFELNDKIGEVIVGTPNSIDALIKDDIKQSNIGPDKLAIYQEEVYWLSNIHSMGMPDEKGNARNKTFGLLFNRLYENFHHEISLTGALNGFLIKIKASIFGDVSEVIDKDSGQKLTIPSAQAKAQPEHYEILNGER